MSQNKLIKNLLPFLILGIVISIAIPMYALISGQQQGDRDLERIAHVTLISEKINELVEQGGELPIPQDQADLYVGGQLYAYQGVLGEKSFRQLGLQVLRDPKTQEFYHYFLKPESKSYEIMTQLEDPKYANIDLLFQSNTFAKGTSTGNFIIANEGENIGKPIHLLTKKGQKIDLLDETKRVKLGLFIGTSCKDILENQPGSENGIYLAQLGRKIQPVYCDMVTDGGGWTLFYANHGHDLLPGEQAYSYVDMRDAVNGGHVFTLYENRKSNLSGLIPYAIEYEGARELLIRNHASPERKWIKATFSTPESLEWSLGAEVLGNIDDACMSLPKDATWSVQNQDSSIFFQDLRQIMSHNGVSWGISHSNFWCNGQFSSELAHLAFYNALNSNQEARARSTQGIGGQWGGGNEYRYLIR